MKVYVYRDYRGQELKYRHVSCLSEDGLLDELYVTEYRDIPDSIHMYDFGEDYHEDDAVNVWGVNHINIYRLGWKSISQFLESLKERGRKYKEI